MDDGGRQTRGLQNRLRALETRAPPRARLLCGAGSGLLSIRDDYRALDKHRIVKSHESDLRRGLSAAMARDEFVGPEATWLFPG